MPRNLFSRIKDSFYNMISSRLIVVVLVFLLLGGILIHRVFELQIVQGEELLNNFQLQIRKERDITSTRGNIYDRNGILLAYNELAYSVKIEDVYENGRNKNANLNGTLYRLIKMIEKSGDSVINDFNIVLDEKGNYAYNLSDTQLLRFRADVYGHAYVTDLTYEEETATAEEMMIYLAGRNRFGVGDYIEAEDGTKTFEPLLGYTKQEALQLITIRYAMSLTSFQKYIGTTVASDISEKTVAVIMENIHELDGVSIEEDTVRRYVDSEYFAHIIGYTGKISKEELNQLNEANEEESDSRKKYTLNDVIGKNGIEASMEEELRGVKGSETVFVDNVGKVISVTGRIEPTAGNDVYLTIDHDLQMAVYDILEQEIAGILLDKIKNIKEYIPRENSDSSDIIIPIYDVYFALFNNNIIDTSRFTEENAGETEKLVYEKYLDYKESTYRKLREEIETVRTPYKNLSKELQVYQSNIVSYLEERGVIITAQYDKEDETYKAWKTEETISLGEFLEYCIAKNWIDVTKLDLSGQYSDSQEIFLKTIDYLFEVLDASTEFQKRIYRYMIKTDTITGKQVCMVLCEQNKIEIDLDDVDKLHQGTITPYAFMINRIKNLEITPAQLALDPFSGSMVITDVNNGDVLALVSYPGYDNNRMANSADAVYLAQLQADKSKPMINYATQQKLAPGSTFKMVSSAAALGEGIVTETSTITCTGLFDTVTPSPRCWIYSGRHGSLNVSDAIKNSCNYFFYDVGYRLSLENDTFNEQLGLEKLAKYADMFGLSEKSGIEIDESEPRVSDEYPIQSAIGQGTNSYTTVGLARYVTTVANSGTCYDLTLIDKITDHSGNLLKECSAAVRNQVDLPSSNWQSIHSGMRKVIETKSYYSDLSVNVAGKTGTAQENTSRANHALFVCYAPYEQPEIAIATRIAYGYTSGYAAQITRDVIKYYYELENVDEIITGTAVTPDGGVSSREW